MNNEEDFQFSNNCVFVIKYVSMGSLSIFCQCRSVFHPDQRRVATFSFALGLFQLLAFLAL